jgi:hypothetical protein
VTQAAALEAPAETGNARDRLRAAHQDLAGCDAAIQRLKLTRHERASRVDGCRAALATAAAVVEAAMTKALADPAVVGKPGTLVDAEDASASAQSELDFAADRLLATTRELTAAETRRNDTLRAIRACAQALAANHALELAATVQQLEREALDQRAALVGLVKAMDGMGVRMAPLVGVVMNTPPRPVESEVNSSPWRRERALADAWRRFIEAALQDPEVATPEED